MSFVNIEDNLRADSQLEGKIKMITESIERTEAKLKRDERRLRELVLKNI